MPATPLPTSTRFIMPGVSKVYFLPAVSAYPAAPTRAEITAGTDLTNEITDSTGFSSKATFVDTPDLSSTFTSKVRGRITADDSSLTFYESRNTTDVRGTLTQGTAGFIMWCDGGDVPTQKADVFKVEVASVSVMRNIPGSDTNKVKVDFSIPAVPAYLVTIPA